jgi:hypothetical protein
MATDQFGFRLKSFADHLSIRARQSDIPAFQHLSQRLAVASRREWVLRINDNAGDWRLT